MTTIITRLYADDATAQSAVSALVSGGIDADWIQVIKTADMGAMTAARIEAAAAAAYAAAMTGGQALLVVTAEFNPVGAARKAIKILSRMASVNAGVANEEVYVEELMNPDFANKSMEGSPLLLTNKFARTSHGHIFGSNPVSPSRPRTSAMRGGGYMSKAFWPMKLVSTPGTKTSAIAGGKLFSSMFGISLLYRR
jgi:hypothetical protein